MARKSFTMRLEEDLLARVDAVKGNATRTAFFEAALELALAAKPKDPGPAEEAPPVTAYESRRGRSTASPRAPEPKLYACTTPGCRYVAAMPGACPQHRRSLKLR